MAKVKEAAEKTSSRRVTKSGVVVSDKADKTIIVEVARKVKHPMYHKYIRRRSRFHVHDESNECRIGDRVLIEESRPMSKLKRWKVKEVLSRSS